METMRTIGAVILLAIVILSGACSQAPEPELSTTSQQIGNTKSLLDGLSPEAYWTLGESAGTTMVARAGGVNGTYFGWFALNRPSAIQAVSADNDPSVGFFGNEGVGYASVPSHKVYSLTRVWDDFGVTTNGYQTTWGISKTYGEPWVADVTNQSIYAVDGNHTALINPNQSGTFEQGVPGTTLQQGEMQIQGSWSLHPNSGDSGALQPISLVAQRTDANNMVRTELWEMPSHALKLTIIQVVNGVNTYLDTEIIDQDTSGSPIDGKCLQNTMQAQTYTLGNWWYVRFHFDGTDLRARAWKAGTTEPTCWHAMGTSSFAATGSTAVRSANSLTTVTPVISFKEFWVQTIGFTINTFVQFEHQQNYSNNDVWVLGKGGDGGNGDSEYYFRFEGNALGALWSLHAYVFSLGGGKGAGQSIPAVADEQWYHIVFELDPGDYNDTRAGVNMYVNGVLNPGVPPSAPAQLGALYRGDASCPGMCPAGPGQSGLCPNGVDICWMIQPMSAQAPLTLATADHYAGVYFSGGLDELAVFPRKLSCSEVSNVYNSSCLLPSDKPLNLALLATASSYNPHGGAPNNAVDGSLSTNWLSLASDPQWLEVDTKSVRDISEVQVVWGSTYATHYQIQVSTDNVNWTTAIDITLGQGGEPTLHIGRSARYVRMYGTQRNNTGGYVIKEFRVFSCAVAPPACLAICGDGRCDVGEDSDQHGGIDYCAADCCGNGHCTGIETHALCPADCP